MSKSFFCQQTIVVDQVCNQEFFMTEEVSRNKVTLRDISADISSHYEEKFGLFHLGTPATAFLVRNLPIDPCNLRIFHNEQGRSVQFPKNSRGGVTLLPSSLPLLTYFKVFMSPSKKFP